MASVARSILLLTAIATGSFILGRYSASHSVAGSTEAQAPSASKPKNLGGAELAGNSEREARQPIPDSAPVFTAPQDTGGFPSPVLASPAAEVPSDQTENQRLAKRLSDDLEKLESATKAELFSVAQRLNCECIAVIMDQAGTSVPQADGKQRLPHEKGTFVFMTNGRIYRFRHGEFPEYDAMMKLWDTPYSGGPKSPDGLKSGGWEGSGQPAFQLDPTTLTQVKTRCQEVLALLGAKH